MRGGWVPTVMRSLPAQTSAKVGAGPGAASAIIKAAPSARDAVPMQFSVRLAASGGSADGRLRVADVRAARRHGEEGGLAVLAVANPRGEARIVGSAILEMRPF